MAVAGEHPPPTAMKTNKIWPQFLIDLQPRLPYFRPGLLILLLTACAIPPAGNEAEPIAIAAQEGATATEIPTQTNVPPTATAVATTRPATAAPPPTLTTQPTQTASATPRPTHTPTITPTMTPIGLCSERIPADDLLTIVTLTFQLSRNYEPADLVPLNGSFGDEITLGYPTQVRQVILQPLVEMVTAMEAAGLQPLLISGYRSYAQQAIAYQKWVERNPETAAILSAPPGFSEHQLGTTVDFSSPELPLIVGEEDIQFHTYFYQTSEGQWLAENAHLYGFTLSYPRQAFAFTGFYYEPWHFRYVGHELATSLRETDLSLTEYLLSQNPEPCIPDATS